MKIIRNKEGRITEIIKDESDGDFNMEEVLKIMIQNDNCIVMANKEIAIAKSQERREIFTKAIQSAPTIIGSFSGCNYNDQDFFMPPYEDQLDQYTDPNSQIHN